jgi:hypothetical protein
LDVDLFDDGGWRLLRLRKGAHHRAKDRKQAKPGAGGGSDSEEFFHKKVAPIRSMLGSGGNGRNRW